jgi:RNA polymerase sigma-70 factor (ECF subfamily)
MTSRFPRVKRWVETEDVLQAASRRLYKSLAVIKPADLYEFLGLARLQIRRELLDLARRYRRWLSQSQALANNPRWDGPNSAVPSMQPDDRIGSPSELLMLTEIHEVVERLPDDERQVVELLYYDGLTQREAAELLGVAPATIKRLWMKARLKLGKYLKDYSA